MGKQNVLVLCTGNSARSQMAEGYLRKHAGEHFEVFSAGLDPKGVNPYTHKVMREVGIDTSGHTSDHVNDVVGQRYFRYIITVCSDADENCPSGVYALGNEKLHWPFEDPAAATGTDEAITAKFREVRDQIEAKIEAWIAELKADKVLRSVENPS